MKPIPSLLKSAMSRRSAIWKMTGLTTGAALASSPLSFAAEKSKKKETIFVLMGDHYHNADVVRTVLTRDIVNDMGISVKMTNDYTSLDAETLKGHRMLIVHRDGRIFPNGGPFDGNNETVHFRGKDIKIVSDPPLEPRKMEMKAWMQPHQGKAVREFVHNGGSALFFHNVTDVGASNPDFRHVLGAAYAGHPEIRPYRVKVKRSDHPIMQGITDFMITDEQHFMTYDKDPAHILMESVNEDGLRHSHEGKDLGVSAPSAWAYEYGKGRVVYLEPGHLYTSHINPMYIKLKKNAVRWLLREI